MSRVFTKSEVRAWLNCMSNDDTRPILCGVCFSEGHLVMTDGYTMTILNIEDDWQKEYGDYGSYEAYVIKRSAIEQWLRSKHDDRKAELTVKELAGLEREDGSFPMWKQLIPQADQVKSNGKMPRLNMALLGVITNVFHNKVARMTVFGNKQPVKFEAENGDIALVMPMVAYGE